MKVKRVLETCLYVADLDKAERFYQDVLGLEIISKAEGRHVFLRCESTVFLLFNPEMTMQPTESQVPLHGAHGPCHVGFETSDAELEGWRQHLKAHQVEIEMEIDWPQGGHSIYFRDPDGNSLEVVTPKIWGF